MTHPDEDKIQAMINNPGYSVLAACGDRMRTLLDDLEAIVREVPLLEQVDLEGVHKMVAECESIVALSFMHAHLQKDLATRAKRVVALMASVHLGIPALRFTFAQHLLTKSVTQAAMVREAKKMLLSRKLSMPEAFQPVIEKFIATGSIF